MATVTTAEHWNQVAHDLQQYYEEKHQTKPNKYFTSIATVPENFITGVVPRHLHFFGPKVCIIFIISKAYGKQAGTGGWHIEWPPPGFGASKQTAMDTYNQFSKYQLNFFGDAYLGNQAASADPNGGVKFRDMLEEVFNHVETECDEMADYGWKWRGRLESLPPASEFYPIYDDFYNDKT